MDTISAEEAGKALQQIEESRRAMRAAPFSRRVRASLPELSESGLGLPSVRHAASSASDRRGLRLRGPQAGEPVSSVAAAASMAASMAGCSSSDFQLRAARLSTSHDS